MFVVVTLSFLFGFPNSDGGQGAAILGVLGVLGILGILGCAAKNFNSQSSILNLLSRQSLPSRLKKSFPFSVFRFPFLSSIALPTFQAHPQSSRAQMACSQCRHPALRAAR